MTRSSLDPECPPKYPLILYSVNNDLILAKSLKEAKSRFGNSVKIAKINDIIAANGHSRTSSILKTIGDEWVCKEGHIFYGE